jgi:hypothetical protein
MLPLVKFNITRYASYLTKRVSFGYLMSVSYCPVWVILDSSVAILLPVPKIADNMLSAALSR